MAVTPRGIGVALSALALVAGGFWFGYPDLVVIGTTAAAGLVFALAYVVWRPSLSVVRQVEPDRVMRGEASAVTLTVSNASRLRAATLIAYDRCGQDQIPVPLLRLRAGKQTTVTYPVPTTRRGVVTIGPLRVVRRDPLGLVTMPRSHGGTERVWVYPTVYPLAAVPPGIARSLDGLIDRVPHGTITFDTLREYVIGDELRHVHWRTTARIGELMVREHLDTSLPRLVILLDDRRIGYPDAPEGETSEAFESACEAAASILLAAFRQELPVALRLVSGASAQATGRDRATRQYLDLLAEAVLHSSDPSGRNALETAVSGLRHSSPGDTLIFLTGPSRAEDLGQIGTLRGRHPTIVVATLGADTPAPSAMDGMLLLAATDGKEFAMEWDGVPGW